MLWLMLAISNRGRRTIALVAPSTMAPIPWGLSFWAPVGFVTCKCRGCHSDAAVKGEAWDIVKGDLFVTASVKAAAYRLHAAHCTEIAQRISDPQARATLIEMAKVWLRLAKLAEANNETQSPPATSRTSQSD
jgi:hypothetical protein